MKYHFYVFGRDAKYKGNVRRYDFESLDEAVASANKLAKRASKLWCLMRTHILFIARANTLSKMDLKGSFTKKS